MLEIWVWSLSPLRSFRNSLISYIENNFTLEYCIKIRGSLVSSCFSQLMEVPLLGRTTIEVLEKLRICSINDLSSLSEEDCIILARKLKSLSDGLAKNGYLKARLIMACRYAKAIRRGKPLILTMEGGL